MYFRNSSDIYGKPVKVIHPGEWHVSDRDEMIYTILGSCVAVCLHDPVTRVSGMNHFMLPGHISDSDISRERTARYGITAMKELLQNLERLGADRSTMKAMIFGGGSMLDDRRGHTRKDDAIPCQNVRIAKLFIEMEDIALEQTDTGGAYSRRIIMDVRSGRLFMRKAGALEEFRESLFLDTIPPVESRTHI